MCENDLGNLSESFFPSFAFCNINFVFDVLIVVMVDEVEKLTFFILEKSL